MPEVNFLVKKGLTVPKGSASTPAVIFDASDSNTGLYSPGADQLALSTNGTGRLSIDSNGHLTALTGGVIVAGSPSGFGGGEVALGPATANLQSAISTSSTGTPALIFDHRGASNTGSFIWRNGTGGSSELMRITGAGLVGIGTSSPSERLDLGGGVSDTVKIRFTMGGNVGSIGSVGSGAATGLGNLTFFTRNGSSEVAAMTIDGSQRVGIGTTSPSASALLDVTSTTAGFLPPRMTTAQRDAISSPAAGLMVYNTSTNKLNFYNGTAWEAVTSA